MQHQDAAQAQQQQQGQAGVGTQATDLALTAHQEACDVQQVAVGGRLEALQQGRQQADGGGKPAQQDVLKAIHCPGGRHQMTNGSKRFPCHLQREPGSTHGSKVKHRNQGKSHALVLLARDGADQ